MIREPDKVVKGKTVKGKPLGLTPAELKEMVKQGDERIKGVVTALVKTGQGVEIDLDQLQEGDLVQYWFAGGTAGHVVIVSKVNKEPDGTLKIDMMGSHRSMGGVSVLKDFTLRKKGKLEVTQAFCVRPKSSPYYSEVAP